MYRQRKWIALAGLAAVIGAAAASAAPVAPSKETLNALDAEAPNANLLLLREVQACRKSASDASDCLELMLLAAERDSGYHSTDEAQEGLPTNAQVAADARQLLLSRIADADVMIGLEGSAPVDSELLLQMERAAPNILQFGAPGSGMLRVALAQQLFLGGARNIASHVLNPTMGATDELVAKEFGSDSLEEARALNTLASIGGSAYATPASIGQLEKAVALRTKLAGAGAVSTAVSMHNLAALRAARGETAEAIRLERAAHSALLTKVGAEDWRTITAALALGSFLAGDGDTLVGMPIANSAAAALARNAPGSPQLAAAYAEIANLDPALAPTEKARLLNQSVTILEGYGNASLVGPLRQVLSQAKGYPEGIFLTENDKAKVQPGNAQEIALLERIFEQKRKSALAAGYQRLARHMLEQKNYSEAASLGQKALALDPTSDEARVIPVYAAINQQPVGQSLDVMALQAVRSLIFNYEQSGRGLSPEVMEAHLMLGLSDMKASGPFDATFEFDKAAEIVKQRLTKRGNFDAKARRDLNNLRPVFRGQVMIDYAASSQLTQ